MKNFKVITGQLTKSGRNGTISVAGFGTFKIRKNGKWRFAIGEGENQEIIRASLVRGL